MWLMPRRLIVIDGADQGRWYSLADEGIRTVGSSHRHADILLNDLYVSRVHCQLKVEGDIVLLTAMDNCPTLVNGSKVIEQALSLGDVVRIGNSHLRFEIADVTDPKEEDTDVQLGVALEEPAFEVVEDETPEPRRVRVEELARQTLGHYQIRAALGQGHFGVVFQALDLKSNQLVALKVLSPDFPRSDAEMQHFARAIKTALPLRHAHLVTTLGGGRTGGYCWLAREYVDGETVGEVIERISDGRKIKWKRALHIATQLGFALVYLHKQRIVHGNITPENVLIRREDRDVKLGDLMLMQALEGSQVFQALHGKKRTAELAYTPPELLAPDSRVDMSADLYSLGALAYGLLTGRAPFVEKNPEAMRNQVLKEPPERPSRLQKHIPIKLQGVVLRLLAKRPEERYATAAEVVMDLEKIAEEHEEELR
jgi:serine/threonine protein kinase